MQHRCTTAFLLSWKTTTAEKTVRITYSIIRRKSDVLLTKNSQFCAWAEIGFVIGTVHKLDIKKHWAGLETTKAQVQKND